VLDKTGTLTQGRPEVTAILPAAGGTEDDVLGLAATAAQFSGHPVARAVTAAARRRGLALPVPEQFTSRAGFGVAATLGGVTLLAGNWELLEQYGIPAGDDGAGAGEPAAGSQLLVARKRPDGTAERLGRIIVADALKPDSAAAVAELHRLGLRTVLLTGDQARAAAAVAREAGIAEVRAEVQPDGKAAVIRQLQAAGCRVAMVGDGINDAPALAAADLGVAIGSGADIAKEAGGVVLVGGSLHGIATAIRLSRGTMRIIRQNLFLAFVYNVLAIPLAAAGLLNPLIAAAAMALSDVSVIGNALRLHRLRLPAADAAVR